MIVTNMPGAGSNAAIAHIYNVAAKDGTFIGAPQNSAIMDALFDVSLGNARRLRHDATKLIHIGSATTDHYVCIARADAPIKTFKQALTEEFRIGASQPNVSQHLAVLRTAGLVDAERDGREVRYRLADPDVMVACGVMRSVLERRLTRLGRMAEQSAVVPVPAATR